MQHFLPLKLYYYLPAAGSASEAYKKRQPNLDFEEMNIPEGSLLTAVGVADQLKVAGPKTVNFEGEEVSITKATRMVKGISYFVSPTPHWRYNGRFLNDIYEEKYTHVEQWAGQTDMTRCPLIALSICQQF